MSVSQTWELEGFRCSIYQRTDGRWQHRLERRTAWGWTGVSGAVGTLDSVVVGLLDEDRWVEAHPLLSQVGRWWLALDTQHGNNEPVQLVGRICPVGGTRYVVTARDASGRLFGEGTFESPTSDEESLKDLAVAALCQLPLEPAGSLVQVADNWLLALQTKQQGD